MAESKRKKKTEGQPPLNGLVKEIENKEQQEQKGVEDIDLKKLEGIKHADAGNILPREMYLEMRVNHLEMDNMKKEFANFNLQIENIDRQKMIIQVYKNEVQLKMRNLEKAHKEFLETVKQKTGIDLRNAVINPETLEVTGV